jgi:hypothetical protein
MDGYSLESRNDNDNDIRGQGPRPRDTVAHDLNSYLLLDEDLEQGTATTAAYVYDHDASRTRVMTIPSL